MAIRSLTAQVLLPDGTPFSGMLRVTPLEEIYTGGVNVAVSPVEYLISDGALPEDAAIVAPGRYGFAVIGENTLELQCFQSYVPVGEGAISLFDLITATYGCPPAGSGVLYLVQGSSITLLGIGNGKEGQILTVTGGKIGWTNRSSDGGGTVWHDGSGEPDTEIGVEGDYYLDGTGGDYYRKEAGEWQVRGNLAGPAGEDGAPGGDGASSYTYIAYASAPDGVGFTLAFDSIRDYIAIKTTSAPIASPAAGDFAGLWKKYKGETGPAGEDGRDGADGQDGSDGEDGDSAYVYIGYASDAAGTGFTTTFDPAKDYIAIRSTTEPLVPLVTEFAGLWKKYRGEDGADGEDGQDGADGRDGTDGQEGSDGADGDAAYLYIAYASSAEGNGFTTVFDPDLDYIAVRSTTVPIVSPSASDFAGRWKRYKGELGSPGADGQDGSDGEDGAPGRDGEDGADGASAYVYIVYASNDEGGGFSTLFDPDLNYIAIKTMTGPIPSPVAADFEGLWKNYKGSPGSDGADGPPGADGENGSEGESAYVYIAYASSPAGAGFATVFDPDLEYIAIRATTAPIASPAAGDFAGLWMKYKGEPGESGGGSGGYVEYAHLEERKPAGVNGGTATADLDEPRLVNTVVLNNAEIDDAALLDADTGTITLQPGYRYHIRAEIICSFVDAAKAIIRSADGTLYADGKPTNVNNNTGLNVPITVECFVDVEGEPLEVQILHRVSRTQTGTGRGGPLNAPGGVPLLGGTYEKYGTVIIMARAIG